MVLTSEQLAYVGGILFAPLQRNIRFELLFVMIFFPGFLNLIYFWIADSYLKAKGEHADAHELDPQETEMQEKKESLLTEDEKQKAEPEFDPRTWANVDANTKSTDANLQTSVV